MRVLLVSPPWSVLESPSLACGTLRPLLQGAGHQAEVRHPSLALAAALGRADYEALAEDTHLLSDAAFVPSLLGEGPRDHRRLAGLVARRYRALSPRPRAAALSALTRRAEKAARALLASEEVASWAGFDAVVFACERDVHNQSLPAAALARRVKELAPSCRVILCGASVEGPVGEALLEAFPWLDWVLQGDAEAALPALLASFASGGKPPKGASRRGAPGGWALLPDLDGLPVPDYADWFDAAAAARKDGLLLLDAALPFEGSRGCWWGERSHCRFCNLRDEGIAARRKSGARLLRELETLSRRHRVLRFHARDNIMPKEYAAELLPRLTGLDLRFFYEMKPRGGRAELGALAAAGVREIQPGIETFSTRLLAVAGKGGSALQNVRFMKWARAHGVELRWFLLHGFPGETAQDYAQLQRLLPRLRHLAPPLRARRLELVRGSPWSEKGGSGFRRQRPYPEYEELIPSPGLDWSRAAHWFDHEAPGDARFSRARARLVAEVGAWREAWSRGRPPELTMRRGESFLELLDSRGGGGRRDVRTLEGDAAWAYAACGDEPATARELAAAAAAAGRRMDVRRLARELGELEEKGLLWEEDGRFLSLALPPLRPYGDYDMMSFYRPRGAAAATTKGVRNEEGKVLQQG